MEGIQIRIENNYNISIIKVGGYIDTTTSSELEHHLNDMIRRGSYNIIIDLSNVDYVSSAGWGIFIAEIKGIREHGGDLKLVGMIPEVYEVFELLEFHYILKAFENLQDAVADFERSGMVPAAKVTETGNVEPVFHTKETAFTNPIAETTSTAKERTLEEKIKNIIKEMPYAGTIQIARQLNTPEYGNEKIGWFGLRKTLKRMGLDSKQKRIGHSRSA
ncbi:MAG: anti-sigma factor antagonist [Calditrichaeota bacterium]|nr:MAG: anti-sigma factor antagonist [Calditrichota bacterium]